MENEFMREAVRYFSDLNPSKVDLIDAEESGINLLGVIRLKDKDGNVLLRIKKDDIADHHLRLMMEKEKESKKLQVEKDSTEWFIASIIRVAYGLDAGYALAILQDNSQLIVYPALLRWKNSIIMRERITNVAVEEVRSDAKKDLTGSIAAGASFGFLNGGLGLIAGATSESCQNVIFKLRSPILGDLLCEAKHDVYKRIIGSCSSFS